MSIYVIKQNSEGRIIDRVKINIFDLDTDVTVKDRIAIALNTLPIYLYFPRQESGTTLSVKSGDEVYVEDLLEQIKSMQTTITLEFINELLAKIPSLIPTEYIIPIWFANDKEINLAMRSAGNITIFLSPSIKDTYYKGLDSDINSAWNDRNVYNTILSDRIEQLRSKVISIQNEYSGFDRLEGSVATPFEVEHISFTILLKAENIYTIMELFNSVKLNNTVPFVSYRNFYKILNDFIPPETWVKTVDEMIVMISEKKSKSVLTLIDQTNGVEYAEATLTMLKGGII